MFTAEAFEKVYKATAESEAHKQSGASEGIVCVHATLKYIASLPEAPKGTSEFMAKLYEACFNAKTLSGFASNASAAAKACGLAATAKSKAFSGF